MSTPVVKRGRPRTFDPEHALDQATKVFRARGYQGASMPELTRAMGLNRPSLYAAFGNKQALFRKVLDRYVCASVARIREALSAPTAFEVAERLLRATVAAVTHPGRPGCLLVQGTMACARSSSFARKQTIARRSGLERELQERFRRARTQGDLPPAADPADLARLIITLNAGLSVQASSGATRAQLDRMVDLMLRGWPRL